MKTNKLPWYEKFAIKCRMKGINRIILDRDGKEPYLERFYFLPRWATLGLYRQVIHRFWQSDDPREPLHSHPWLFWCTYILKGGYIEHTPKGSIVRKPGDFVIKWGWARHRVELFKDENGKEIECWSFFGMGPKFRVWGFWDEESKKEIPHDIYLKKRMEKAHSKHRNFGVKQKHTKKKLPTLEDLENYKFDTSKYIILKPLTPKSKKKISR